MYRLKFLVLNFSLLLLLSSPTLAQTKHQFSLQQAVDYASKNNVQVKNALLNVQMQEQNNKIITAAAFPTIDANVGTTYFIDIPVSLIPGEVFGQPQGTYIPVQFGTKYNTTASVQLKQLLFDGQVFVGLQARDASMQFQKKAVEVTEQNIKANVQKIYYQLVVAKKQVELLDANITRLKKLQHDVNEIYKNGFAEKLDVDKLVVSLNNLQTEKQKVINNISIGYVGLKTLMGMPIADELILTDEISETEIKKDILLDSVQYSDRKEYQYLQIAKDLNNYNIKRYQLSYLPTISFNANYSKQALRNKYTFFERGDWFTSSFVGLNINMPIFSGFSKDSKLRLARLDLQQTTNNIENLKITINAEAEQAKLKLISAIETIDIQKRNMLLAEKVYDQTKKKYEVGTGSNTEITTAETELKAAQTNYIAALYDAIITKVDYLKAVGKL
ncbi:MAG: TolC family protein [Chitinophagaceae bacterium]|nr:TolC family protein [Chitinophagaceae bacterium]